MKKPQYRAHKYRSLNFTAVPGDKSELSKCPTCGKSPCLNISQNGSHWTLSFKVFHCSLHTRPCSDFDDAITWWNILCSEKKNSDALESIFNSARKVQ